MRNLESRKNQTESVAALIVQRLERERVEYVFFGDFDISGRIRGRDISRRYLALTRNVALQPSGSGFADFYNPFESLKVKSLSYSGESWHAKCLMSGN